MRYVFVIALTGLLLGCSSKQVDATLEKDTMLNYSMTNSKKVELSHPSSHAKTFVTITYLNPIKHTLIKNEKEQFLVGTYMATGEESIPKVALANFEVNTLPKEEINVRPLRFDDPLLTVISSANPWTDYLLVEAPKTDDINMTIRFENDLSSGVSVNFRKDF